MRLRNGFLVWFCWALAFSFGSGSEPEPAVEVEGANPALLAAEMKQFQGNWRLVSHEANEHKKAFGKGSAWKLTVTDNQWKMTVGTDKNSKFKIDPTQTPKHIDRTFRHGDRPTARKTIWPGIYHLEGDRLTICHSTESDERPTEFATKINNGVKVLIWERVKADAADAARPKD